MLFRNTTEHAIQECVCHIFKVPMVCAETTIFRVLPIKADSKEDKADLWLNYNVLMNKEKNISVYSCII